MKRSNKFDFRPSWRRALRTSARAGREEGQAIVEFALVFSLLAILLLGIISFGIAFDNQITLTHAANNAAQVVMSGSGVITDPCASVNSALAAAATNLNNPNIYGSNPLSFSITAYTNATNSVSVGPYTVAFSGSGQSCQSEAADLTQGQQVVVTATYGCNLTIFGHNFAPNCKLTAQTSEVVQ